jgi:hypothetical protein
MPYQIVSVNKRTSGRTYIAWGFARSDVAEAAMEAIRAMWPETGFEEFVEWYSQHDEEER